MSFLPELLRGAWVHQEEACEEENVRVVVDVEDTPENAAFVAAYLQSRFVAQPKPGCPGGTVIANQTLIGFDVHPPIDRPLVANILDPAAPTCQVAPRPPTSRLGFLATWSGAETGGSGVAAFDHFPGRTRRLRASGSAHTLVSMMKARGTVYLVGAGPGDVGLLTLRGAELLRRADVVVYDGLVNPELLRFAPKSAEVIYGGKRSERQVMSQETLNRLLVGKAEEGKTVVRLKGGDPYIFGRGGEEAAELAAAGIPFEVVPGISSMSAVPNYAGIPLTHREHCSSFTVLTGHEDPMKEESTIDWAQVAAAPGTKVVMMGLKRIRQIAEVLMRHGLAGSTPVAMVRWGTTGRQQSIQGTLDSIGDLAEKTHFGAPTVTVIGEVVKLREQLNWFEKRPLFGQRVVVTRAREQAGELASLLSELGAEVLEIPTIKIVPPENKEDLKDAVLGLHQYDWVVFTSPNGVKTFFDYFLIAFDDLRDIGGVRIAAVGPATAARIKELHLKVDLMPQEALASKIVEAFQGYESIENLRILLMRAEAANPELPAALEKLGAIIDDVACYKTVAENEDVGGAAANVLEHGADWITFTSGSTVEHFHARFGLPELLRKFPRLKLATIGPETSKALQRLGLSPTLEAPVHTAEGLVEALRKWRSG